MYKTEVFKISNRCRSGGLASLLLVAVATSMIGCGRGSKQSVAGLDNFYMAVKDGRLVVSFLTETLHLDAGGTAPIPGLKDATLGINPDLQSKGTIFMFSFNLTTLFKDAGNGGNLRSLPGGQPIPDVTNGMLPEWDARVGAAHFNLYLSKDVFGFFIPMDFLQALPATISQEINDSHGNLLGRAYAIPTAGSGTQSGLLVLVPYVGG